MSTNLMVAANCLVHAAACSDCTKLPWLAEVFGARGIFDVPAPLRKSAITDCAPDS
jgi:hypothetical protein